MSRNRLYLDSSALVKLVVPEAESEALSAFLRNWEARVSSDLARVELQRAACRVSSDPVGAARRAAEVLEGLDLLRLSRPILALAGELEPLTLRSLDAIHLSSALSLGDEVGAFVTYDLDLADAARVAGLLVLAPK